MTGRRALVVGIVALLAVAVLVAVLVTGNMAQQPMAGGAAGGMSPMTPPGGGMGGGPPGGMMGGGAPGGMGMAGGMGGMGGAAAGGAPLTYEETTPPPHLQKTFDEWLAETGRPKVPVPKAYVLDDKGKPAKLSPNQWEQLYRIYQEGLAEAEVERGEVGGPLADQARSELDHINREFDTVRELYRYACENCFSADIGRPIMGPLAASNPSSVGIRLDVVFRSTKSFPDYAVKRLTPLSIPGWPWRESSATGRRIGAAAGRARLDLVTRAGGFYKPAKLYLDAEAIGTWVSLWNGTQVRVTLFDTAGKAMAQQTLGAGLSGNSITQQMIFPPYIRPHREIHSLPDVSPWGTKVRLFSGTARDLYSMKGWRVGGSDGVRFTIPVGQLVTLNGAEIELVPSPDASAPPVLIGRAGTHSASRERAAKKG